MSEENKTIVVTEEQADQVPGLVAKWSAIGMATGPCDMEKAFPFIKDAYAKVDAANDLKYYFTARSPIECAIMGDILQFILNSDRVETILTKAREGKVPAKRRDTFFLTKTIKDNFREVKRDSQEFKDILHYLIMPDIDYGDYNLSKGIIEAIDRLYNDPKTFEFWQYDAGLNNTLVSSVKDKDQLRFAYEELFDEVRQYLYRVLVDTPERKEFNSRIEDLIRAQCYGNNDAHWLTAFDFLINVVGVKEIFDDAIPFIGLAQHVGLWAPFNTCVIGQDRFEFCHFDQTLNAPSCTTGPAIRYSDGYCIYSINDILLNGQIVNHPETLTVEQIQAEDNQDRQAIMLERFTMERYLNECGAKQIDPPTEGEVQYNDIDNQAEVLFSTPGVRQPFNIMMVTCPTKRRFCLPVPPTVKTCAEGRKYVTASPANMFKSRKGAKPFEPRPIGRT